MLRILSIFENGISEHLTIEYEQTIFTIDNCIIFLGKENYTVSTLCHNEKIQNPKDLREIEEYLNSKNVSFLSFFQTKSGDILKTKISYKKIKQNETNALSWIFEYFY